MAGDIKNKRVNIFIDQSAASAAYEKLITQQAKYTKSINDGTAAGKNMVTQMKKLDEVNGHIKKLQDQMDKGLKPSLAQQTTLVTQLRNELKRLSESDPQFGAKLQNFKQQNAELQRMQGNVSNVTKSSEGLSSSFGGMVTKLAAFAAGAFAFDKIIGFFSESIAEANKAEQAASRLNATLSNIGRQDAFQRLKESAKQFAETVGTIDDDDVVEVFQKLITYGKLTENQIKQLTPVIIDLAAHQGIDLAQATDLVVKSLEGNNKGLKEYGINVKDASTVTGRLGVIMGELKPKVEGAAQAFGETTAGQIQKTTVQIEQLKEEIGTELQPVVRGFYQVISGALSGLKSIFENVVSGFKEAVAEVGYVSKVVGDFITFQFKAGKTLMDQHGQEKKNAEEKIAWTNAQAQADKTAASITGDALTKSTAEQNKILQQNINLANASRGAYQELEKQGKQNTEEGKKAFQQMMEDTKVVIALKEGIAAQSDKRVLGSGNPDADPDAGKKAEEAAKKLEELKKQAQEFLKQLGDEDFLAKVPNDMQQIALAAKKYFEDVQKATDLFNKHLISPDEFKKALAETEEIYKDKIHDLQKDPENKITVEVVPQLTEDVITPAQMAAFTKKLQDQLTPAITKLFSGISDSLNDPTTKEIIDTTLAGINDTISTWQTFTDLQNQQDERHLEQIEDSNAIQLGNYKKMLNGKLITSQQYAAKEAELNAKAAQEREIVQKKEFERNKRIQIAQALINGATAILSTLAARPGAVDILSLGVIRAVQVGLVAATTAAQVAAIASSKYAEGGKVHSGEKITGTQNVPTQSNGDNMLAYVKTGEVILNERQQKALGGPGVFAAIGVPGFEPAYKSRPYMAIDTAGITSTYTKLRYAGGGVVGSGSDGGTSLDPQMRELMNAVLFRLENPVNQPLTIQNNIQLKQITDANDQLTRIKQNAILQ